MHPNTGSPGLRMRFPAYGPPDCPLVEGRPRQHGQKGGGDEAGATELDRDVRLVDVDQAVEADAAGAEIDIDHGPGIEPERPAKRGAEPRRPAVEPQGREYRRQQAEAQEGEDDDEQRAESGKQDPSSSPQLGHARRDDVLRVHVEDVHPQQRQHVDRHEQQQRGERAGERCADTAPVGLFEVALAADADSGITPQQPRNFLQSSAIGTCDRHSSASSNTDTCAAPVWPRLLTFMAHYFNNGYCPADWEGRGGDGCSHICSPRTSTRA